MDIAKKFAVIFDAVGMEKERDYANSLADGFKNAIGDKANKVAINPMNYVNKVVVNYKNPGRTFAAPYFSSVYSGMMLDRYV